jgi:hypothetical protein
MSLCRIITGIEMSLTSSYPGTWLPLSPTGARVIIDAAENEVSLGNRYTCLFYDTTGVTGATSIVNIRTNALKEIRLTVSIDTFGAGVWRMTEDSVVSGGTALVAYNNNRKSDNICDVTIIGNPTVATIGTVIGYHVIGAATGGASKSGGNAGTNPWILKQDTNYMFTFTAIGPTIQVVQGLYFFEGEV